MAVQAAARASRSLEPSDLLSRGIAFAPIFLIEISAADFNSPVRPGLRCCNKTCVIETLEFSPSGSRSPSKSVASSCAGDVLSAACRSASSKEKIPGLSTAVASAVGLSGTGCCSAFAAPFKNENTPKTKTKTNSHTCEEIMIKVRFGVIVSVCFRKSGTDSGNSINFGNNDTNSSFQETNMSAKMQISRDTMRFGCMGCRTVLGSR